MIRRGSTLLLLLAFLAAPEVVSAAADRVWDLAGDFSTTANPTGLWAFGSKTSLGDVPVPADYSGNGHAQIAVFRPATAEWFLRGDGGAATRVQFGAPGDVPVPGDYQGLRRAQIAVYRPGTGEWFIRQDDGSTILIQWGGSGDLPIRWLERRPHRTTD